MRLDAELSGTTSYTYDHRGNRTAATKGSTTTSYQWNLLGQASSIGGVTMTYGMDGIRTTVGTKTQVYDQDLKLLSDGDKKYLWAPDDALLAQAPVASTNPADTEQMITDSRGSIHAVTNSQLQSIASYSYSAFGERTLVSGADKSVFGYTSEQHDPSGLRPPRSR